MLYQIGQYIHKVYWDISLDSYQNIASWLIKYVKIDLPIYLYILSIPGAIFQGRAIKFGTLKHLM